MPARPRHTTPSRGPAALLAAVCTLFALAGPALAGETIKTMPTLSLRETYDSNVNLNGKGDFEHSATVGVRVDMQQERARSWIRARGIAYKYTSLSEYDRIDQSYEAGLEVNATQNITVNLKGSAVADHAFSSSLADTGERARTSSRQVYSVQPSVTFNVDETNALTLFHSLVKTLYDTRDYTDSLSNTLGGLWGYRLNERAQLLLQLSGTRIETATTEQNSLSSMGGFEYALAETIKARVLGGVSSLSSTTNGAGSRKATNYAADTSLEWRLEKLFTTAGYSRDMTLGISGGDLVRDKFSMNFTLNSTERLQLLLGGNLVISESVSTAQATQSNRWLEIMPSAKYQMWEHAFLTLGYSYGAFENTLRDELKTRNRVYLDFSIAFP